MTQTGKHSAERPAARAYRPRRKAMLALVLAAFIIGYTSMVSLRGGQCNAQAILPPPVGIIVDPGVCIIDVGFGVCVDPCDVIGTSLIVETTDETTIDTLLQNLTDTLPPWIAVTTGPGAKTTGGGDDGFIGGEIDSMMQSLLLRLNDTELDMMDWWDTMWWYNLRPAMQAMTRQWNTSNAQQAEDFQSGMDAFQEDETNLEDMNTDNKNHQQVRVSENGCVAATASGGLGRQQNYNRAMRQAWQDDTASDGQNRLHAAGAAGATRPSASGVGAKLEADSKLFESTFCDKNDNGGHNAAGCTAPTDQHGNSYANADIQVTKNLYNKLTMEVEPTLASGAANPDSANEEKVVEAVINNTMGDPTGDPIQTGAMDSPAGHEQWLNRRSYLARYGAIRSVPQLIAGWRMPGSKLASWIQEIEKDAGVPTGQGEMSDNPSYREILHAISIDRFNSGKYANNMISDSGEIEMEKLTIQTFYLMQLRDYYELLEREALTLAVQDSLMAEKVLQPSTTEVQSIK